MNIWKFSVHVLFKCCLENFEHYLVVYETMQLCSSLKILWHCHSLGLEWKLTFSHPEATAWVFQICWHIECSTFTASSVRSSTGIPSLPPVFFFFFVVMLPKAHLTLDSRIFGSSWVITPSWFSGSLRSFCVVFMCILATSS